MKETKVMSSVLKTRMFWPISVQENHLVTPTPFLELYLLTCVNDIRLPYEERLHALAKGRLEKGC